VVWQVRLRTAISVYFLKTFYTEVEAPCDTLATVVDRPKLTTLATVVVPFATKFLRKVLLYNGDTPILRWIGSRVVSVRRRRARVQFAVATLSGKSLRQTVHTRCASVHQAAKLVAALL